MGISFSTYNRRCGADNGKRDDDMERSTGVEEVLGQD
jgi:hypothetical protein